LSVEILRFTYYLPLLLLTLTLFLRIADGEIRAYSLLRTYLEAFSLSSILIPLENAECEKGLLEYY